MNQLQRPGIDSAQVKPWNWATLAGHAGPVEIVSMPIPDESGVAATIMVRFVPGDCESLREVPLATIAAFDPSKHADFYREPFRTLKRADNHEETLHFVTRDLFTLAVTIWQPGIVPTKNKDGYWHSANHPTLAAHGTGICLRTLAKDFFVEIKPGECKEVYL